MSVIIPTYNRAGVICETVENILRQTYTHIELIVVDDGSTDDTQSRLAAYGDRIRLVIQENAGAGAARNHGIAVSRGEILAFQDSDDTWHPTKIERQVSLLERAGESVPCCLCSSTVYLHDGRAIRSFDCAPADPSIGEGLWLNPSEVLATRFILFNQAVAIRRNVLDRVGGFDESFRIMEDVELQLRLSLEGPWTFIREPLATRQEKFSSSLSHEGSPEVMCENEVLIREAILRRVESSERFAFARPVMEQELKRARRRRFATQLRSKRFPGASVLGQGLEQVERLRSAAYRRMPWFPKMKVASLEPQSAAGSAL